MSNKLYWCIGRFIWHVDDCKMSSCLWYPFCGQKLHLAFLSLSLTLHPSPIGQSRELALEAGHRGREEARPSSSSTLQQNPKSSTAERPASKTEHQHSTARGESSLKNVWVVGMVSNGTGCLYLFLCSLSDPKQRTFYFKQRKTCCKVFVRSNIYLNQIPNRTQHATHPSHTVCWYSFRGMEALSQGCGRSKNIAECEFWDNHKT